MKTNDQLFKNYEHTAELYVNRGLRNIIILATNNFREDDKQTRFHVQCV